MKFQVKPQHLLSFFVFVLCLRTFSTTTLASYSSIYALQYHQSYQAIHKKNKDVIGWLTIPGTTISEPILHTSDNEYYLNHNPQKKSNREGSVFLDYRNHPSFLAASATQSILYGHNLQDSNLVFAPLLAYEDQSHFEQHPDIVIATEHEILYYRIFAAYTTSIHFYYLNTQFTDASFLDYIADIRLRNRLVSSQQNSMHRLLTLSTCSYRFEQARFVIHAVEVYRREAGDLGEYQATS